MTKIVKPFEPQEKGYTIVDNVVFDYILPALSANGWKILCFIIRKTKGWQKEWDGLSYSQIMEGTGIKSSATISKVLSELLDGQYIKQVKADDQFTAARYALNTALEIEVANGTTLENEVDTTLENEPVPTLESEETKQIHETNNKETNHGDQPLSLQRTPYRQLLKAKMDECIFEPQERRGPKKFPTTKVADKFDATAKRLNGHLESAIDTALEQGCTSLIRIVNYIAKWQPNGGKRGKNSNQRSGSGVSGAPEIATGLGPKAD